MLKWLKRPLAQAKEPRDGAERAAEARRRGNAWLDDGKLGNALQCYRDAVALDPEPEGFVSLGYTLREMGRAGEAKQALEQALRLDPGQFDAAYMLGALAMDGRDYPSAIDRLSLALELQPASAMALGELCRACFLGGEVSRAWQLAETGAAQHPQLADFHFFLGNILTAQGQAARAVECFDRVLRIDPGHTECQYNRALALQATGRLDEAAQGFRAAIELRAGHTQAFCGLASVLIEQGRAREAMAHCRQALAVDGTDADAHNSLGNALHALGRHEEAAACFRQAIALQGGHAQAHTNLGLALMAQDRMDLAVESLRKAVELKPDFAPGHNNLGIALLRQGRLEEAAAACARALAFDPASVHAHSNTAAALLAQGHHEQAVEHWRQALALKPDYFDAWSNLVYVMSFLPGVTAQEYLGEATRLGRAAAARARPFTQWPAALQPLAPGQPLRVGFVSGDFREHPVGFFLEGILEHMDPSRVLAIAYATRAGEDRLTARIKPRFHSWHSLDGLNDEEAALKIHADGVHILVDLAGHSEHNRLRLFAWRPAPAQLAWLGYFASTGMPGIDYLIADHTGVPAGHRGDFSEAIRYMPHTRLCFTAPEGAMVEAGPLPAQSNGCITFGCFQNMTKLNDGVLALWGKVFKALPDARLRHQSGQMGNPLMRERLLQRLQEHGIARSRVELSGPTGRQAYLAAHRHVDIMLDTFPYTGGTTTCESLWMGVPTMTLAGRSLLARQGASLLSCAGLSGWVADSETDYVERLLRHCADLDSLAALRLRLREQVLASPLFDSRLFARDLEALLHDLWNEKAASAAR